MQTHTNTQANTYTHINTHTHTHTQAHMHTYNTHKHTHTSTHSTQTHTHKHAHKHAHTRARVHTHKYKNSVYFTVIKEEQCPFENSTIFSKSFTPEGGVMIIKEYGVTVIVPEGAIESSCIKIQAAANLFGPFIIPEDCRPVSPYVWISADYVFKKKLQIEIEHHADVASFKDTSQLCVLKSSCSECSAHDHHFKTHIMTKWNINNYNISDTVCTLFSDHFCSYCLASKTDEIPDRIIAYHYLPHDYRSADSFKAELCFCYDLTICKNVCSNVHIMVWCIA